MAAQQEEARIKEGRSTRQVARGDRAVAGAGDDQSVRQADRGDRAALELTPSEEARIKECVQFFEELVQLERTAFIAFRSAKSAVDEARTVKRRRRCTSGSCSDVSGSISQSS